MLEWNQAVQKVIDWLEDHLTSDHLLWEMSRQVGYSPYYGATLFHRVAGVTIKGYVAGRRLARAAYYISPKCSRAFSMPSWSTGAVM